MALLIATILILSVSLLAVSLHREGRLRQLRQHYLQSILTPGDPSERYLDSISGLSSQCAKTAATEVITTLSGIIHKLECEQLTNISDSLHLTDYLLEKARKGRAGSRAQALAQLSLIPNDKITKEQIKPFLEDKNRMVRFFALLATINIDKNNLLHHIASYSWPLTQFEVSQLLNFMRRISPAIAYSPLLESQSYNLNLLGLATVREFGIESAELQLREMVESGHLDSLRCEALYTLAGLHCSISSYSIRNFLKQLSPLKRQRFLRFAASEGYSQRVIDLLADQGESGELHSLISSYKVKIGCY